MKVALITGSLPPDPCGVGDYTYKLYKALSDKGIDVEILCRKNWRIKEVFKLYKELKNMI